MRSSLSGTFLRVSSSVDQTMCFTPAAFAACAMFCACAYSFCGEKCSQKLVMKKAPWAPCSARSTLASSSRSAVTTSAPAAASARALSESAWRVIARRRKPPAGSSRMARARPPPWAPVAPTTAMIREFVWVMRASRKGVGNPIHTNAARRRWVPPAGGTNRCAANGSAQLERVRVEHRGEVLAMRQQFAGGERRGHHDFGVRAFAQRAALEIDYRAFAGVMQAVAVGAHAVEAGDEAQVLHRTRAQQQVPGVGARRGPVRYVQQQVVVESALAFDIEAIARKHREAQVVTDQRTDAPTLPFHGDAVAAGGVALVFLRVTEQMAL